MNICFWGEKKYKILKNPKTLKKNKTGSIFTFQHFKSGTDVDLACTITGDALVNGCISVYAQRLDPQHRPQTSIKFNHLEEPQ